MPSGRSRNQQLAYDRHRKTEDKDVCAFCNISGSSNQLVEATKHFQVITNLFPYSVWDSQDVADHLMVTPKAHTDSLADMTAGQKVEYVDLIEKYESQGYNIYSRAPGSVIKSILHQHTHLIKTEGNPKKFVLLLDKPYIRVVF